MDLNYEDIERVLVTMKNEKGYYLLPDDTGSNSLAVIGQYNGQIVDCFFGFGVSLYEIKFSTPSCKIVINPVENLLVYHEEGENVLNVDNAFEYPNLYPFEYEQKITHREMDKLVNRYKRNYIHIRNFAFKDKVNKRELEILKKYKESFERITPKDMKQFYIALSPEFFEWMDRQFKSNTIG